MKMDGDSSMEHTKRKKKSKKHKKGLQEGNFKETTTERCNEEVTVNLSVTKKRKFQQQLDCNGDSAVSVDDITHEDNSVVPKKKKKKCRTGNCDSLIAHHCEQSGLPVDTEKLPIKLKKEEKLHRLEVKNADKKKKHKKAEVSNVGDTVSQDNEDHCKKKKKKHHELDSDTSTGENSLKHHHAVVTTDLEKKPKKKKHKKCKHENQAIQTISYGSNADIGNDNDGKQLPKKKKKQKKEKKQKEEMEQGDSTPTSCISDESALSKRKKHKEKKKSKPCPSTPETNVKNVAVDSVSCTEGKDVESVSTSVPSHDFGQWGSAEFSSENKKEKFLRLLGGFKKSGDSNTTTNPFSKGKGLFGSKSNMAMNQQQQKEMSDKLSKQYDHAMDFHLNKARGGGLGFAPPPGQGKKFHIDEAKLKSKRFDD